MSALLFAAKRLDISRGLAAPASTKSGEQMVSNAAVEGVSGAAGGIAALLTTYPLMTVCAELEYLLCTPPETNVSFLCKVCHTHSIRACKLLRFSWACLCCHTHGVPCRFHQERYLDASRLRYIHAVSLGVALCLKQDPAVVLHNFMTSPASCLVADLHPSGNKTVQGR